jgi:hypothetical protein
MYTREIIKRSHRWAFECGNGKEAGGSSSITLRLGHASTKITPDSYSHLMPHRQESHIAILDDEGWRNPAAAMPLRLAVPGRVNDGK